MPTEQSSRTTFQRPTTVVLVDDEHLIRGAIAQALSSSGVELVGEASNGEDGIEVVVDVRPDVVLLDLRLPGISGVEAIEQLGLLAPRHGYWCSLAQKRTAWSRRSSPAPAATS